MIKIYSLKVAIMLSVFSLFSAASIAQGPTVVFGANGRLGGRDCTGSGICKVNSAAPCCKGTTVNFSYLQGKIGNGQDTFIYMLAITFINSDAVANGNFPANLPNGSQYVFNGRTQMGNVPGLPQGFEFPDQTTWMYAYNVNSGNDTAVMLATTPIYYTAGTGYTLTVPGTNQPANAAYRIMNQHLKSEKKGRKK